MLKEITFSKPVLFLEFFVRDYRFYGKGTVRTELPKEAFFYTGASKAVYREKSPRLLCFKDDVPFLSESVMDDAVNKLFKENTNVVSVVSGDYFSDGMWFRDNNRIFSNKTGLNGNTGQLPYANFQGMAPYNFNIKEVLSDGTLQTDFPRKEIQLAIKPRQTLCFLCHQVERGDGEWYSPNVNLVLFVRNYGFFDKVAFVRQEEIDRMDDAGITRTNIHIRDFRKSSLNFELG